MRKLHVAGLSNAMSLRQIKALKARLPPRLAAIGPPIRPKGSPGSAGYYPIASPALAQSRV